MCINVPKLFMGPNIWLTAANFSRNSHPSNRMLPTDPSETSIFSTEDSNSTDLVQSGLGATAGMVLNRVGETVLQAFDTMADFGLLMNLETYFAKDPPALVESKDMNGVIVHYKSLLSLTLQVFLHDERQALLLHLVSGPNATPR